MTVVVFLALLGACIWVGGLVAIVVITRIARSQLDRSAQVAFFRALGRQYLVVGVAALVVALAAGGVLLADRGWDGTALAATLVAAALVLALIVGVIQARGMTRLRTRAAGEPDDAALADSVRRGAMRAGALRAAIVALTLALLALAAALAT